MIRSIFSRRFRYYASIAGALFFMLAAGLTFDRGNLLQSGEIRGDAYDFVGMAFCALSIVLALIVAMHSDDRRS